MTKDTLTHNAKDAMDTLVSLGWKYRDSKVAVEIAMKSLPINADIATILKTAMSEPSKVVHIEQSVPYKQTTVQEVIVSNAKPVVKQTVPQRRVKRLPTLRHRLDRFFNNLIYYGVVLATIGVICIITFTLYVVFRTIKG